MQKPLPYPKYNIECFKCGKKTKTLKKVIYSSNHYHGNTKICTKCFKQLKEKTK